MTDITRMEKHFFLSVSTRMEKHHWDMDAV